MPTKKTTQQTAQFDPTSMSAFQNVTPAWSNQAKNFISSPYSNPQFQLDQQLGTRQAQNLGQTGINQLMQNFQSSGMGGGIQSPFMQEMLANQGRANTGLQANLGFINPMQNALQRQLQSMQLAQSYHPLQTGQKQVEGTSGLGTWLPQVAGLALAPFTGGGSLALTAGGLFGKLGGHGGTPQWAGVQGGGMADTLSSNPWMFGGSSSMPSTGAWNPMSNTNWNPGSGYVPGMSSGGINPFGMSPGIVPPPGGPAW